MIDLPSYGKHFDKALATGLLTASNIAYQGPYKTGGAIPRLFKGLLLKVFDEHGVLKDRPDIQAVKLLRQLYYLAKKYKVACSESVTWEHVNDFFETDREIRPPSLDWEEDEFRARSASDLHFWDHNTVRPAPLFDLLHCDEGQTRGRSPDIDPSLAATLQRVSDLVSAEFGRFEPSEWGFKHGPGAVADGRSSDFKYDFPTWPAKLENVFPMSEFGFSNLANWAAFANSGDSEKLYRNSEPPSKLHAVPKTLKGPRLIAAEPTSHLWCQQSILSFFLNKISHSSIAASIHIKDQSYNREMARLASHTQSHATIDLSSASDRLSCWVIERLFRRNPSLLSALHASRTRWVSNTIDRKSPQYHVLKKFACMGSACTFPVQSIAFCCMAISALLFVRGRNVTSRNMRSAAQEVLVYGDDIIVPIDCVEVLQGVLGGLGLKVNLDKTFYTGRFRESCGLDAFDGVDVTPAYAKAYPEVTRPESIVTSVATHNNFLDKGYFALAAFVRSTVQGIRKFRIPEVPIDSGTFGWFSCDPRNIHLGKPRWNSRLQLQEFRVDRVRTRQTLCLPEGDSVLLQYFTVSRNPPTS